MELKKNVIKNDIILIKKSKKFEVILNRYYKAN